MANLRTVNLAERVHAAIAEGVEELKEQAIRKAVEQFEKDLRMKLGTYALGISDWATIEREGLTGNLLIHIKHDTGRV
jgi:hypothetical protein